jgi:hypothetical protein
VIPQLQLRLHPLRRRLDAIANAVPHHDPLAAVARAHPTTIRATTRIVVAVAKGGLAKIEKLLILHW